MEGVGLADAGQEGLGRGRDGVHPLGLFQRGHVGLAYLVDARGVGQAVEQPFANDLEHLSGVLLHGGDGGRIAVVVFGQRLAQRAQLAGPLQIDVVLQVGDDNAGARQLSQGVQQPLQGADGQVAKRGATDRLPLRHLQIARQLVEQDQHRLVPPDRRDPVVHAGRLGPDPPEPGHGLGAPQRLGHIAPQQVGGVLVAVEHHHLGGPERRLGGEIGRHPPPSAGSAAKRPRAIRAWVLPPPMA